jgi:hypothetical protein
MLFKSFKDFEGFPNRYLAHIRIRRDSQQARFREGAQTPIETGRVKPFHYRPVMHMALLGECDQDVHIKQVS